MPRIITDQCLFEELRGFATSSAVDLGQCVGRRTERA
jgi:hypothetical protein